MVHCSAAGSHSGNKDKDSSLIYNMLTSEVAQDMGREGERKSEGLYRGFLFIRSTSDIGYFCLQITARLNLVTGPYLNTGCVGRCSLWQVNHFAAKTPYVEREH